MQSKQNNIKNRLPLKEKKNVEESDDDDRFILNGYKLKRKANSKPVFKLNEYGQTNYQQNLFKNSNTQICQDNKKQKQFTQFNNSYKIKYQNYLNNNFQKSQQYPCLQAFQPSQKDNLKAEQQPNRYANYSSQLDTPKTEIQNIKIQEINESWQKNYDINQMIDKENIQGKNQVKVVPRQKNNLFVKEKDKIFSEEKKFTGQDSRFQSQRPFYNNKQGGFYMKKLFYYQNINYEKSFDSLSISDSKSDNYGEKFKTKHKKGTFSREKQSKFSQIDDGKQGNQQKKLNNQFEKAEIIQNNSFFIEENQQNGEKQMQEQFDLIRNSFVQNEFAPQAISEKQTSISNLLDSLGNLKQILNYFYSYKNIKMISSEVFEKVYLLNLKKIDTKVIPIELKTSYCDVVVINHGEAVKIDVPKVLPFQNNMLDPRNKNIKFNYK
ncbi:hypothetical protein ABPG72_010404 [Tetrahymena utriculariae]